MPSNSTDPHIPRLVIAAPSSGQGKTTATLAMIALLREAGLNVATFKCGPDYLDPTWHEVCSGNPCYNLDSWMMGKASVKQTFSHYAKKADVAIIEGVMGLFDGAHPRKDDGSTASVAKLLDAPVILVVNVRGMARSCSALVHGFASYDADLSLKGVVCNGIGSKKHEQLLKNVLGTNLFLGGLIRRKNTTIPERHLGLYPADEASSQESWSALFQTPPSIKTIMTLASQKELVPEGLSPKELVPQNPVPERSLLQKGRSGASCRIGVAKDKAFFFLYRQNLDLLEECGAEIVFFSPLKSRHLPDVHALYFPGGYPELHALRLSQNDSLINDIQSFSQKGLPIYAECGGLMYIMKTLQTLNGTTYPMVGLLEGTARMEKTRQALGYVEVETQKDTLLGSSGTRFRGHQFRYSHIISPEQQDIYRVRRPRGEQAFYEGFTKARLLGSYIHGHWASNPQIPKAFVKACG